ncbi:chlamydia polymorphic membrane family protein [Chlamydia psittaci WC]|uniref:polymorphic outer membrane protein middle domain-containing protein n=1 Tax=Chlamydia psittaci TaxID=83554 RepID=UPI00027E12CE|nr:polymorphic outer membrane protein middle domain-containing protein [Chlamydia psittaci]AFS25750.1 chlamydia polymorphic membrane family protein [Chlamydia psittaci WC]
MKHPVYWFLMSSSLLASHSLGFAEEVQTTLTPSDSYNGNTASSEFEVKDTSTGVIYTCEGNVCISYAGKSSPLKTSCFSETTGNLSFIGNGYTLCFDNITTEDSNPGAINVSGSEKTLDVTGFSLFSCAHCPPGTTGYGAIQTKGIITLKDNSSLVFHKNCSTTEGGAIKCQSDGSNGRVKLVNNQNLVFSENSSAVKGGAIYADKLTIVSGGPTLFSNNSVSHGSSPQGGAICLNDTNSKCSITANLGDIIFDGNKIITTSDRSSPDVKRNSIDLGSGKFTNLRAKEGFGIFFYDPIANTGDTTTEIELNKADDSSTTTYTGKIVFSGERLSDEEKKVPANLQSYFKQPLKIGSGSLVLKDGVTLEAKQVTQTAGSSVVMDLGTTLQTPSSNGDAITLTNLDINVASLGGGGLPLLLKSQHKPQIQQLRSMLLISSIPMVMLMKIPSSPHQNLSQQ